jgi:hypothetical protein
VKLVGTRVKVPSVELGCSRRKGRWESSGQQPASIQRSGGVCVDSASGSPVRVNWENCGDGKTNSRPKAQAGSAREAQGVAAVVGVLHSSIVLHYFKRSREPREDTCSMRRGEAKDAGMAGATRIVTPQKVRKLQIALYRKAKTSPKYRFWSLYGELLRRDLRETNAVLRGWTGYFHFRNSTSVMGRMRRYSQNRLRRWVWRKHACTRALWKYYSDQRLREHYGLYELPVTAAWKAAR